MKKQKVHLSFCHGSKHNSLTACGADICSDFSPYLKVTDNRKKVTCKNCRATKRFRRIK